MRKIILLLLLLATIAMGAGGTVIGNPGPLTAGYYYRADLTGTDGKAYTNYYGVTSGGHIYTCNRNGYSTGSYPVKMTMESDNGRIATMTWMNEGGTWTEIQTVHIMRDDNRDIREVNVWRSVTNRNSTAWCTYYTGTISSMGTTP